MPEDKADLAACTVLAFGTWFSYVSARKFFLQELYSYHGWMYEARKNVSLKTKIWAVSRQSSTFFNIHKVMLTMNILPP